MLIDGKTVNFNRGELIAVGQAFRLHRIDWSKKD